MRFKAITLALAAICLPVAAQAAGSSPLTVLTLTATSYSQNFDSLANTGTSSALPTGFGIVELGTGSAANGEYVAGTGSSNAGNAYSFGAAGSTERALGSVTSGSVTPVYLGGVFANGLAGTIESLGISFVGEQWRVASQTPDSLFFEYSLDATNLSNGSWTSFSALDFDALIFSSSASALNGNAAANRTAIDGTIAGLAIAPGANFGFRWVDNDVLSADQGLAIDDLTINATLASPTGAVPEPATWALLLGGFAMVGGTLRARKRLTPQVA